MLIILKPVALNILGLKRGSGIILLLTIATITINVMMQIVTKKETMISLSVLILNLITGSIFYSGIIGISAIMIKEWLRKYVGQEYFEERLLELKDKALLVFIFLFKKKKNKMIKESIDWILSGDEKAVVLLTCADLITSGLTRILITLIKVAIAYSDNEGRLTEFLKKQLMYTMILVTGKLASLFVNVYVIMIAEVLIIMVVSKVTKT